MAAFFLCWLCTQGCERFLLQPPFGGAALLPAELCPPHSMLGLPSRLVLRPLVRCMMAVCAAQDKILLCERAALQSHRMLQNKRLRVCPLGRLRKECLPFPPAHQHSSEEIGQHRSPIRNVLSLPGTTKIERIMVTVNSPPGSSTLPHTVVSPSGLASAFTAGP